MARKITAPKRPCKNPSGIGSPEKRKRSAPAKGSRVARKASSTSSRADKPVMHIGRFVLDITPGKGGWAITDTTDPSRPLVTGLTPDEAYDLERKLSYGEVLPEDLKKRKRVGGKANPAPERLRSLNRLTRIG